MVAAADTTGRHDWGRGYAGMCVHHVAMMSPLSGQSDGRRESEDSKTDDNASGHGNSSSVYPPQERVLKL